MRRVAATGALLLALAGACGEPSPHAPAGMAGRAGANEGPAGAGGGAAGNAGSGGGGGAAVGGVAGGGSPPALPAPASQLAPGSWCESDGWCWYNQLPSGNYLRAVAGAGRTDLWIGGETFIDGPSSMALHFDGGRWALVPSPLAIIAGIWAAAADDVWFVGADTAFRRSGAIAHWDGVEMTVVASPEAAVMTDVWGAAADDVYAVGGDYGDISGDIAMHWDGNSWTRIAGVGGNHVAGTGPNDVWIGGTLGLKHFDGTRWVHITELAEESITALAAVGPGEAWVVVTRDDARQQVIHVDASGVSLSFELPPSASEWLRALGGSSQTGVWLVGDTFITGARGYLNHYDGQSWTRAPNAPESLTRVAGVPGFGDIAVGQRGGIVSLTSNPTLGFTDLRSGSERPLSGVFGSSPADMWAVGDAGTVWHHDGQAVSAVPAGTSANLSDVWGTGPSDVWAVGAAGTVLHFDGRAFAAVASGTTVNLNAVFTARPDDVWIGGDGPTLLHWDGGNMTPVTLTGVDPGDAVLDLHGIAAGDIWLSGSGFVAHFDGAAWSPAQPVTFLNGSLTRQPLPRIWQLAADDVWVAAGQLALRGGGPDAYAHFDGTSWTELLLDLAMQPQPEPPFMFPNHEGPSFVFGAHDRWRADFFGGWQRNTR